jgi:hypothetical protein
VIRGWLAAILRTFRQRPSAGIVSPLFLGTLRVLLEAGSLIWQSGNTGALPVPTSRLPELACGGQGRHGRRRLGL